MMNWHIFTELTVIDLLLITFEVTSKWVIWWVWEVDSSRLLLLEAILMDSVLFWFLFLFFFLFLFLFAFWIVRRGARSGARSRGRARRRSCGSWGRWWGRRWASACWPASPCRPWSSASPSGSAANSSPTTRRRPGPSATPSSPAASPPPYVPLPLCVCVCVCVCVFFVLFFSFWDLSMLVLKTLFDCASLVWSRKLLVTGRRDKFNLMNVPRFDPGFLCRTSKRTKAGAVITSYIDCNHKTLCGTMPMSAVSSITRHIINQKTYVYGPKEMKR